MKILKAQDSDNEYLLIYVFIFQYNSVSWCICCMSLPPTISPRMLNYFPYKDLPVVLAESAKGLISARALLPPFLSVNVLWDAHEGTWTVKVGVAKNHPPGVETVDPSSGSFIRGGVSAALMGGLSFLIIT